MSCCEQEDTWYVLEKHAECRMCLVSVPRLAPVERSSSLSCAVVRMMRTVFSSAPSCEQYLGLCVVNSLFDAPDDSSSMAHENCSCTVISIHFITHGSGAVACAAEDLSLSGCLAADAGAALVDARLLCKPRAYSRNSQKWSAFKFVFKSYIGVVADPILAAMDHPETLNDPITLAESVLSGPPLQLMMNVGDQNGLEAWRLLVRAEQPVSGANKIAATQSILLYKLSPQSHVKPVQDE